MKKLLTINFVILIAISLVGTFVLVGCDSMNEEDHSTEPGRNGANGFSLILSITPSRAPSNNDATMNVHIRFVNLDDVSPVANQRVRLMITGEMNDPDIVSFADDTLMTDIVTNANGEADLLMYVGSLGRSVAELFYELDAQSTVEYDYYNTVTLFATETFYIYNPFWDGTRTPDTIPPTAVINFYPSTGISPGTTITFMGANSYDRGDDAGTDKAYDEIIRYSWNFADGSYATGSTVTHVYAGVGTYSVELLVVDDEGMTGQTTASVTVAEYTPTPTP